VWGGGGGKPLLHTNNKERLMIKEKIYAWSNRRIRKLYGEYDIEIQYPFYRCHVCHSVVNHKHLNEYAGCSCGGGRLSPTNLSVWEEIRVLFMPWSFRYRKVTPSPAKRSLIDG